MTLSVPQPGLETTQTLVARARAGDRAALEQIAARYQPALARFAHGRMPGAARGLMDTCDLVQLAIVRTLSRLDAIEVSRSGSLLAYLRRAVLNQVRDEIRRVQRRPAHGSLSPELPSLDQDPLDEVINRETLERYEAALMKLPPDQQEAFILRIEMKFGYQEIAQALGRPSAESARMLVRRAVRALAERLRESASP